MEFLLNGTEPSLNPVNSAKSENQRNHSNMNCVQFKYPLCYYYLLGAVVGHWFLT